MGLMNSISTYAGSQAASDDKPASEIASEMARLEDALNTLQNRLADHVNALQPVLAQCPGKSGASDSAPTPVMDSPLAARIQSARFTVLGLVDAVIVTTSSLRC